MIINIIILRIPHDRINHEGLRTRQLFGRARALVVGGGGE